MGLTVDETEKKASESIIQYDFAGFVRSTAKFKVHRKFVELRDNYTLICVNFASCILYNRRT